MPQKCPEVPELSFRHSRAVLGGCRTATSTRGRVPIWVHVLSKELTLLELADLAVERIDCSRLSVIVSYCSACTGKRAVCPIVDLNVVEHLNPQLSYPTSLRQTTA